MKSTRTFVFVSGVLAAGLLLTSACGSSGDAEPPPAPTAPTAPTAPPAAPAPNAAGSNYGSIPLSAGFVPDPTVANGVSGGNVDATTMSAGCNGYVSSQPDHLVVAATEFATLRIMASAEADVTLVVQKPDGTYACNDDTEDRNPVVALSATPAGTYKVWIGSFESGTTSPYRLGVSELNGTLPSSLSSATAQ